MRFQRMSDRQDADDTSSCRRWRFQQMRHAIFLAVAGYAEIEVWIAQFGRAAHGAFVEWLGLTSRTPCVEASSRRDFAAMPSIVNYFWTEKDQIIGHRRHQRHAIGINTDNKTKQQECRRQP